MSDRDERLPTTPSSLDSERTIRAAWELLRQGQFQPAETLCRNVLAQQPRDPGVLFLLGYIANGQGRIDEAMALFEQTLASDPRHVEANLFLASGYRAAACFEEALEHYEAVLESQPGHAEASFAIAAIWHENGDLERAAQLCHKTMALAPNWAEPHVALASVLREQGDRAGAIESIERSLALDPGHRQALALAARILFELGELDEAEERARRALANTDQAVDALVTLARIELTREHPAEAAALLERALQGTPEFAEAADVLALALEQMGRRDEAEEARRRARSARDLATVIDSQRGLEAAILRYEKAIAAKRDYEVSPHHNVASLIEQQNAVEIALAKYEEAAPRRLDYSDQHRARYAVTHYNLGNALLEQGQYERCITQFERAVDLEPNYSRAYSNLLLALNYPPEMAEEALVARHREYDRRFSQTPLKSHSNKRDAERRLRIGYVSSDFRRHSVAFFIEPVIAGHDRTRVEVTCYYSGEGADDVTARIKTSADRWRDIQATGDDELVELIRADEIDILVDLNGHTGNNRLPVFARKPAPVQVTWIGYPNTTGLSAMDYRISDAYADPEGETEEFHTEKLYRLPECFSCYAPPSSTPDIGGVPATRNGFVTFGSFNYFAKINSQVIAVWAALLQEVADSRLLLKNSLMEEAPIQRAVVDAFAGHGIGSERLELIGFELSQTQHFERYNQVDVALDTFPYNGTTTTCDALWMGVPVVTLAGRVHRSRVGLSQLTNLGLTELIAETREDYVSIAAELAQNSDRLDLLRRELRERLKASPLMAAERLVRNLESAYREMWVRWCESTS